MGSHGRETEKAVHTSGLRVRSVEEIARVEAKKQICERIYTEYFHKIIIRTCHTEANKEKVA